MAPSDIDLVYPVSISLGFAKNRAMLPFQVDPCDRKRIILGVAAEAKGEGIPDRNQRRQADVLISPAGRGNEPTAAFGQYPEAPGATASTSPAVALPKPQAMIETANIHIR